MMSLLIGYLHAPHARSSDSFDRYRRAAGRARRVGLTLGTGDHCLVRKLGRSLSSNHSWLVMKPAVIAGKASRGILKSAMLDHATADLELLRMTADLRQTPTAHFRPLQSGLLVASEKLVFVRSPHDSAVAADGYRTRPDG